MINSWTRMRMELMRWDSIRMVRVGLIFLEKLRIPWMTSRLKWKMNELINQMLRKKHAFYFASLPTQ